MKYMIFVLMIVIMLFSACTEKKYFTLPDTDGNGYYTIENGTVAGPSSISFDSIHKEATVRNHSGTHMGFDLRLVSNLNIPVVAIPFIAQGETKQQIGVDLFLNVWYRVISVFYKIGLGSLIIQAIQLLGLDFINQIEDWMIDSQYEAQIRFTTDSTFVSRRLPSNMERFRENTRNQTFTKLVISKRAMLEANGINVEKLLQEIQIYRNK